MYKQNILLTIDTSTEITGISLSENGNTVCSDNITLGRATIERLPAAVMQLLDQAGIEPVALSYVAVSLGPGSYTGVRIGIAFLQGIAVANNIPILGIRKENALAFPYCGKYDDVTVITKSSATQVWAQTIDTSGDTPNITQDGRLMPREELTGLLAELSSECLVVDVDLVNELSGINPDYNIIPINNDELVILTENLAWKLIEDKNYDIDCAELTPIYLTGYIPPK